MKLEPKESIRLITYKERLEKKIFGFGIGIPLFLLVLSFIPIKRIPHRNAMRIQGIESESTVDLVGILPVFFSLFALGIFLTFYLMSAYKYRQINDDIIEKNKEIFRAKVRKVLVKTGGHLKEVDLFIYPAFKGKYKIEFFSFRNFPKLEIGQEVEIVATSNAVLPLKITPIGQSSNIDDNLDKVLSLLKNLPK